MRNNNFPQITPRLPSTDKSRIVSYFNSDSKFDQLYPSSIRHLARRHWTPIDVARKAAAFLAAESGTRILDIGCGTGKFCLAAGFFQPRSQFCGVEQRASLIAHADKAAESLKLSNVSFIHDNFTRIDFREFDHFYFYNSFYENLTATDKIDDSILYSNELYQYYSRYLFHLLDQKPEGTRLATYHSTEDEIPPSYHVVGSGADNLLKFWVKIGSTYELD